MVEIRWSIDALDDLESIISYIEQDSPEKAIELVKGIFEKIEQLKQFPYIGRKFPDRKDDQLREIILKHKDQYYQTNPCQLYSYVYMKWANANNLDWNYNFVNNFW